MSESFTTLSKHEPVSKQEADLRNWMSAWFDYAVAVGFIQPPWVLKDEAAQKLEGYFSVGLTPSEGAAAFFGTLH
ncbi:hypothetical protein FAZ69_01045 [Trinickia terrae]|uniref:Uncharacterized protein n=1 Tax=Trinickia terrae TaxID=2571161 RepID=A0A4U1IF69_9BURK|nr:hypothetical protein [Trinickia terrae]TKC92307.1 hypothetical protein FAZ69_01045 [Trinickia terrae]